MKLTAIISLMLIGAAACSRCESSRRHRREATAGAASDPNPGGALWASALSCNSCGSECASACGTRHFRTCCFNYLRKKRTPLTTVAPLAAAASPSGLKLWLAKNNQDLEHHRYENRLPVFVENVPDLLNEIQSLIPEEQLESNLQLIYDA